MHFLDVVERQIYQKEEETNSQRPEERSQALDLVDLPPLNIFLYWRVSKGFSLSITNISPHQDPIQKGRALQRHRRNPNSLIQLGN